MMEIDPDNATIPQLLAAAVAARPEQPSLGAVHRGLLTWRTWRELGAATTAWAADLAARGVHPGDRVAQFGPNSAEWIIADLAIQSLGAVHVPIHASLSPSQVAEQTAHSESRLLLIADHTLASDLARRVPTGTAIVLPSEMPRGDSIEESPSSWAPPMPDDLATILYTSGTTGAPRGVMLTHRNLTVNAIAMVQAVATAKEETRLCLLPLSHIYARTCDLYCWLYRAARLVLPESRETVLRDCQLARPTVINAVPYFYQRVADGLRSGGGPHDGAALRAAFGGEIIRCFCGGAALPAEVERFFEQRGLPILCGYGLSEAAPVITASNIDTYVAGTVGRPLANVEVRLADDGEVFARGPSIMSGYWKNEAESHQMLRDGWLHTGDLGAWTAEGNLRIVGRKKEMIVLATGKKVAPTRIEQLIAGSPLVEQCCVVGDGRKCLAALIVPRPEMLRAEIRRRRLWVWSKRRAVTHPRIVELYREEIDRCLAEAADFEQIGAFTLLTRGFSIDAGELTPKLSLRRDAIERRFAREIEAMYRAAPRAAAPRLATLTTED